jgi:hypothetical protein
VTELAILALVSGAIAMAFAACGLFFIDFYRRSGDRLFLAFALSFWTLAAERVILVIVTRGSESEIYVYMLRLLAFLVLLVAIIDRNRRGRHISS